MALYGLEPWGEERADLRAGTVAAAVVNSNPYRKKEAPPAKPADFMPNFLGRHKRPETPEQKVKRLKGAMACWRAVAEARQRG